MAQTVKCLPEMRETRVPSLGWEDPLEKEMATHSSLLPRKFCGWRSLVGYSPWGRKELDTTATSLPLGHHRALGTVLCAIQSVLIK